MADALKQARGAGEPYQGIWSWLSTVDHKKIGIMYGVAAFFFFLIGGIEALLDPHPARRGRTRTSSTRTSTTRIFTMHGTTMIFLVVMPLGVAFMNLLIPLMIGARDVAFPRLNAFSFWVFLARRPLPEHQLLHRRQHLQGRPRRAEHRLVRLRAADARTRSPPATASTSGCSACRSSASRRSPVASTSSSRSSTCARRA